MPTPEEEAGPVPAGSEGNPTPPSPRARGGGCAGGRQSTSSGLGQLLPRGELFGGIPRHPLARGNASAPRTPT